MVVPAAEAARGPRTRKAASRTVAIVLIVFILDHLGAYATGTVIVVVVDIAVPAVDVAKRLTEYVPGARPNSTS